MANTFTHAIPQGTKQLLHNERKLPHGSPKMAPKSSKQMKTNIKSIAHGARTGDPVSDESDDGDDEGDSSTDDDDDDLDEPDDIALSGAARIGNGAASRLAGLSPVDVSMLDDQAVAGAPMIDEEDYDGINEISDADESVADDDEKVVLRSAEKDLIAEFERTERPRTATAVTNDINGLSLGDHAAEVRRSSMQSEDSEIFDDLEPLDVDFNQDPFQGLSSGDSLYQDMMQDAEGYVSTSTHMSTWRLGNEVESHENSAPSSVTQKRVRFDERTSSRASSMSSNEEDARNAFPDLFDGNDDQLLYAFMPNAGADALYDNESVYDFEDEYERQAFEIDEEASDSHSDESDFSCINLLSCAHDNLLTSVTADEDDGDTTDEEDPEVLVARVKAMRNARENASTPASTPNSEPSTPVPGKRPTAVARAKTTNGQLNTPKTNDKGPKMGTFIRDPTKARVEADVQGSGVKVTCPTNPPESERAYWERARKAMGSRDGSPNGSLSCIHTTPRTASIPKRPLTAKATLGTMFDGNLDFLRNNDEWGIAEDLVAMSARNDAKRASFTSTTTTSSSTAAADTDVNMADFVELSDSDPDMDEPQSASVMSPTSDVFDEFVTTPHNGNDGDLLEHFDQRRGLISSFRNNQTRARHVSSLAANPAKRAQTSENNALQPGRRAAANTPMTPARKNRASQDLTGAGIRKVASPLVQKHRRSRGSSLSQTLGLGLDRFVPKTD